MDFLTPHQVAEMMKCSYKTILKEIACGKLPAIRLRGTYRIPQEEFEGYLEAGRVKRTTPPEPVRKQKRTTWQPKHLKPHQLGVSDQDGRTPV
jgi:excisionase family DNA binding protein